MSDLIERLRFCANLHPQVGYPENGKLFAEAATALAEAQATIARQQVMLDRALEASFDDKARADRAEAEIARLRAALTVFSCGCTGRCDRNEWLPAENDVCPSRRARAALSRPHATKGDEG